VIGGQHRHETPALALVDQVRPGVKVGIGPGIDLTTRRRRRAWGSRRSPAIQNVP
jgi:hypothetical protein